MGCVGYANRIIASPCVGSPAEHWRRNRYKQFAIQIVATDLAPRPNFAGHRETSGLMEAVLAG